MEAEPTPLKEVLLSRQKRQTRVDVNKQADQFRATRQIRRHNIEIIFICDYACYLRYGGTAGVVGGWGEGEEVERGGNGGGGGG